MSDFQRDLRAVLAGATAAVPVFLAILGWALHWNAYINLSMTAGSFVIWFALIEVLRTGERRGQ